MRVRAKIKFQSADKPPQVAYYNGRRVRQGEVFDIPDTPTKKVKIKVDGKEKEVEVPRDFSFRWMEEVKPGEAFQQPAAQVQAPGYFDPNVNVI